MGRQDHDRGAEKVRLAATVCLTAALMIGRPRRARLRLASRRNLPRRQGRRAGRRVTFLLAAGGALLLVAFGPVAFAVVAAVVGVALGLRPVTGGRRHSARQDVDADVDIALCIDLLGAAMPCGASPSAALLAVARAAPGTAGSALAEAATALSLGADPHSAWSGVAAAVPQLRAAAQACARAATSGAAVSEDLFRLAAAARAARQVHLRRRMQRAGVWLVLPLGLCFLPAFVLVAVVPVVLAAVPALVN